MHPIDGIIHFAGYKAVGESVSKPLMYYQNNLISTFNLIEMMQKHNCKNIIFSHYYVIFADINIIVS